MLEKLYRMVKSEKEKESSLNLGTPVPDFIPYACHWNAHTVLTKNGELLQIIKITGFSREAVGSEEMDLREMLRHSVLKRIRSEDFALWFHTVRTRRNLDPGGSFPPGFSKELNQAWRQRHEWESAYVNEVYVTILCDGKSAPLDGPSLLQALAFKRLKSQHIAALEDAEKKLTKIVDGVLLDLKAFGARRLGVYEEQGVFYSEPLQFFGKILYMADLPVPMPLCDISEYLAGYKVAIGFDIMEVRGHGGKKFGALFTLKEYSELSPRGVDKLLQLPLEFIITQTLDFIGSKSVLDRFRRQHYLLQVGRDPELSKLLGLDDILAGDDGGPTAFGASQITIFLMESNLQQLLQNVDLTGTTMRELGLVAPRRDLRLEECFWSQLPGNFSYVRLRKPMSTAKVGGFASLYSFPAGKRVGNHWGPAVTLFYTIAGTPYFFSFHIGDNGHTAILGPRGTGKTVLLNFLVSESRKFKGRLFFFDHEEESRVFIQSMGGYYTNIVPKVAHPSYAFNPLNIEDTPENRKYLQRWFYLLASAHGAEVSAQEIQHFEKLVEYSYRLPQGKRRLSALAEYFGPVKPGSLGEKMAPWHGKGEYAHMFDNDRIGVVPLDEWDIYGFCMSEIVRDHPACLGPVLSYLLHRMEMGLDGRPTMIVLDEAWSLVNNPIFGPDFLPWLNRLREKNAMVIFATETIPNDRKNQMTNTVVRNMGTLIFLPNVDAADSSRAYREVWGLSDEEYEMLSKMRVEKRQFMLRQNDVSVVANLDLSDIRELEVLSGSQKKVAMMQKIIKEQGNDPVKWLPVFYENI